MTIRMRFSKSDRITIDGVSYRYASHTDEGVIFNQVDISNLSQSYTYEELADLLNSQSAILERGYFDWSQAKLRLDYAIDFLADLPKTIQSLVLWKQAYCQTFYELAGHGYINRTEKSVAEYLPKLKESVDEIDELGQYIDTLRRSGKKAYHRVCPCAKTLLNWLRQYEEGGQTALALVPKTSRSGNRRTRFDPVSESFLIKCIDAYASVQRPSKKMVIQDTITKFKEENHRRVQSDERLLHIPSKRTIVRRISNLDPYYTHMRRYGIEAANHKFTIYEEGVPVTYPMERIEVDEWKIDLISLFSTTGILDGLTPKRRKEIEKGRRWLYVALDCATRCVVAMRLSESPNALDAVRTLEDATRDKTSIADAVGCESYWNQYGGLGAVVTDMGSAFIAEPVRTAITGLGGTYEYPPAGVPKLRSHIERIFRIYGSKLMPLLTGRTFSNPQDRGDYPSETWAALTDDDLMEALVTFVVDIYHNEPHGGLGGETPANCWNRLLGVYGTNTPPDAHTRKAVFGHQVTRKVSGKGVRVLSVDYTCKILREFYLHNPLEHVSVRVDPHDLGWVTVYIDDKWRPAQAVQKGFDGVSFYEWREATRKLRTKHAHDAVLSQDVVARAIERISKINRRAMQRLRLTPFHLSAEDLEREERRLYLGLSIDVPNFEESLPPETDLFDTVIPVGPDVKAIENETIEDQPPVVEPEIDTPKSSNPWRLEDD